MTIGTLNMGTGKIKQLQEIYSFKDREPGEVLQFIEKYPFLISLLLEAPDKVREFFPDAGLALKVNIDPESYSEDSNELLLLIKSDIDPEESVDILEELDYAWGLDISSRSQRKMFIDNEF
ncbi:MAG: hypothetical protein AB4352_01105 [Hormoscilla sp.]